MRVRIKNWLKVIKSMWKPLNRIYKAIGVILALIAFFAFVTGISDLPELLDLLREQPAASPSPSLTVQEQQAIEDVLQRGSNAIIEARWKVSEKPLYGIFTDNALTAQQNIIKNLRDAKVYALWTLHDRKIESVTLDQVGTRVVVKQATTWSATIYSGDTKQCTGRYDKYESAQTVVLTKEVDDWVISRIDFAVPTTALKSC